MLLEDVRAKSPIETITNIIGDTTYKAITELREALYANAAATPTALGGGRNGHVRLIMYTSVFANVSDMAYTIPTDLDTYAQHGADDTATHKTIQTRYKRRSRGSMISMII